MRALLKSKSPLVMGILNITPDSFSDGGQYFNQQAALQKAQQLIEDGADIIDVGGESTRPGAADVSEEVEIARVVPAIKAIAHLGKSISIDTSKPGVMRAAIEAGATIINDVRALQSPGALEIAVEYQVSVCLMHMQGSPRTMQQTPHYHDVVAEVFQFLAERIETCVSAGLPKSLISIDPGFGFGKSLEHNLALLQNLAEFQKLEAPILVGLSRKSMLGQMTGKPTGDRMAASIAGAMVAVMNSASIVRVHDVAETVDALNVLNHCYNNPYICL